MTETPAPPPRLTRPRFDLWAEPDDPGLEPAYLARVTITNGDQLLAETQAKGLGIDVKAYPFHLTALWVWAAAVRVDLTSDKFKVFTTRYAWEGVKDPTEPGGEEGEADPTPGAPGPSTASASPSPGSSEEGPPIG